MGAPENASIENRLRSLGENERLFRINAGEGWAASREDTLRVSRPVTVRVNPGDVVLRHPRRFKAAPDGWPDTVGWETVRITEDMVGLDVAVFVGEEHKPRGGRLRRYQGMFRDTLERMGGIFRVRYFERQKSSGCADAARGDI